MGAHLHQLINKAFGGPSAVLPAPTFSRRRKKLWELPHRLHCPLVGTCLPVAEMRKLAARAGFDECEMSDYTLHTHCVGSCESRTELAELIQRYLDKRYAPIMHRFNKARGEEAVLALWQEALAAGKDVAAALWAVWTHADLSEEGGKQIYGDIHMLSHQDGAQARADLRELERLRLDNMRLRDEATALRHGLNTAQHDRDRTVADLQRRLRDTEQHAALLSHRELELAEARRAVSDYTGLYDRAEAMGVRIETLEERNALNAHRAEQLAKQLNETQDQLAAAEAALEMALGVGQCNGVSGAGGCGRTCPAEAQLAGRCVLCIGGRTHLVNGYRRLVETQGGRFLHHDGGQEESLHRIDAAISGADAVVCQSACISHAAYYRLKDVCKKLGKPCVFVQSPGIVSFARGLATIGDETAPIKFGRPG